MSKKILVTGAFLAMAMPFSAQAQGVPAGMNYGRRCRISGGPGQLERLWAGELVVSSVESGAS